MTKGEIIAALVALAFKEDCGPFGGEDPYLEENSVGLHSQMGITWYTFSDEGGVDLDFDESARNNLEYEGINVDEDIQLHWDNVIDFLESDDGWFMEFQYDHPKIIEAIKAVLAI